MNRYSKAALAGLILGFVPATAAAQAADPAPSLPPAICDHTAAIRAPRMASPLDELRRTAEIGGCLPILSAERMMRRAGARPDDGAPARFVDVRVLPASWTAVGRSAYPDDRNNGALWEGVGFSSSLRFGVLAAVPFVTVAIQPELLFHQNGGFDHDTVTRTGYDQYASPWYTSIDLPQRFGSESFAEIVAGDSYIRFDAAWFAAGASTESLWRGPALRYPIMMSNTAGGFPHLFVGTNRGVDVWIGRVGGELVWGELQESAYFDDIEENDVTRLVNASFTFEPRWLNGLSLGVSRSFHYYPVDDDGLDPLLGTIGLAFADNRNGNEIAGVFGRWMFERSGAEVYAEWARDDVLGDWPTFFQEPDHAQAYTFGFQKITPLNAGLSLRVHGELVHLQEKGEDRTDARPLATFYTNSQVTQGYTHRGQLLGAGVGPGADAQFLAFDAIVPDAVFGAYFERVRRNDLSQAAVLLRQFAPFEHDAELIAGVRGTWPRAPFALSGDLSRRLRYNRDFGADARAWRLELQAAWDPDLSVHR